MVVRVLKWERVWTVLDCFCLPSELSHQIDSTSRISMRSLHIVERAVNSAVTLITIEIFKASESLKLLEYHSRDELA